MSALTGNAGALAGCETSRPILLYALGDMRSIAPYCGNLGGRSRAPTRVVKTFSASGGRDGRDSLRTHEA